MLRVPPLYLKSLIKQTEVIIATIYFVTLSDEKYGRLQKNYKKKLWRYTDPPKLIGNGFLISHFC